MTFYFALFDARTNANEKIDKVESRMNGPSISHVMRSRACQRILSREKANEKKKKKTKTKKKKKYSPLLSIESRNTKCRCGDDLFLAFQSFECPFISITLIRCDDRRRERKANESPTVNGLQWLDNQVIVTRIVHVPLVLIRQPAVVLPEIVLIDELSRTGNVHVEKEFFLIAVVARVHVVVQRDLFQLIDHLLKLLVRHLTMNEKIRIENAAESNGECHQRTGRWT
jgi:hypothetical protein